MADFQTKKSKRDTYMEEQCYSFLTKSFLTKNKRRGGLVNWPSFLLKTKEFNDNGQINHGFSLMKKA